MLGNKPKSGCEVTAKVVGENDIGSPDMARNDARNKAADQGANSMFIDEEISNGSKWEIRATAYECH